jgi:non-heme Fe2+,alpha-ketoglutarate-dependent halogenase
VPRMLSPAMVESFKRDGYTFPIQVFAPHEVAVFHAFCASLDLYTPSMPLSWRTHLHLHFRRAYELATHPAVLDAVEDLLGPDIIILSTILFAKRPGPGFVSWHQDGRYLVRDDGPVPSISAWIALTESHSVNGCLRAIPGSHRMGPLPHRCTHKKDNMLLRGETIHAEVDESRAVDIRLGPGQMSLHHVDTFHGSGPNRSSAPRIGFTVRYAHPRVASTRSSAPAVLARGKDSYGKYLFLQTVPSSDFWQGLRSLERAVRSDLSGDKSAQTLEVAWID